MTRKILILLVLTATCIAASIAHAASSIIVEKNLFSADRKPTSSETAATPQATGPPLPPKAIQLDGIMVHGSIRRALLRLRGAIPGKDKEKKESPFTTVSEGEKVGDYTVTKIGTRSVSFEKAGQSFEVYLFAEGKVLPPLAPTPTAPPGQPQPPPNPNMPPGAAPPPGQEAEGEQNAQAAPPPGTNAPANPAAVQGGQRRPAMPSAVPLDTDEGDEEDAGDAGQ